VFIKEIPRTNGEFVAAGCPRMEIQTRNPANFKKFSAGHSEGVSRISLTTFRLSVQHPPP
jgi:hypothetical protein